MIETNATAALPKIMSSATQYPAIEITVAIKIEITFRLLTIFPVEIKGIVISNLMINVAGAQIGAVSKSARHPPSAPAIIAYGVGKIAAAR